MARMQLYLPDDLYELVKASGLPASELFQNAVRAELKRRKLLAEADVYLKKLEREVGAPTRAERARAAALAERLAESAERRPKTRAG